jgi:hypothetical protein
MTRRAILPFNCWISYHDGEVIMSTQALEGRVTALESELARLKSELQAGRTASTPWWKQIAGVFANDPAFDEAMRLGRQYRQAQRPPKREGRR